MMIKRMLTKAKSLCLCLCSRSYKTASCSYINNNNNSNNNNNNNENKLRFRQSSKVIKLLKLDEEEIVKGRNLVASYSIGSCVGLKQLGSFYFNSNNNSNIVTKYMDRDLVLHLSIMNHSKNKKNGNDENNENNGIDGHVFIFETGSVVFWGLPLQRRMDFMADIEKFADAAQPATLGLFKFTKYEEFEHEFSFNRNSHRTYFQDDFIEIEDFTDAKKMLAISYGFALSSDLVIYEDLILKLHERTKVLPDEMAASGTITVDANVRKKLMGELLQARYAVADVGFDETPELFWRNPELETVYRQVVKSLEISKRVSRVYNQLDYIKDTIDIINQELSRTHSQKVEHLIVGLIAVEVLIALTDKLGHYSNLW